MTWDRPWQSDRLPESDWLPNPHPLTQRTLTQRERQFYDRATTLWRKYADIRDASQVADIAEGHIRLVEWIQAIERGEPPRPWQPM